MSFLSRFRLPRPRRFLGFFDLQIGVELILLCALFNKLSGIYGVLAILTGAEISAVQMSMYIYSLLSLIYIALLSTRIRERSALPCITFAYFYVIDSLINATYTLLFSVTWFLVISEQRQSQSTSPSSLSAAGKMIEDFSGLAGGPFNETNYAGDGVGVGGNVHADGQQQDPISSITAATLGNGVLQPESATSILIICVLWAIRIYFCLVVLAYARQVVRETATPGSAPFGERSKDGEGWRGKVGRTLVGVNRGYWEGPTGWNKGGLRKFRRSEEPDRREAEERRRASLPM